VFQERVSGVEAPNPLAIHLRASLLGGRGGGPHRTVGGELPCLRRVPGIGRFFCHVGRLGHRLENMETQWPAGWGVTGLREKREKEDVRMAS